MPSPSVSVRYPAANDRSPRVISLRVVQKCFMHDVVVVKYFLTQQTRNRYREGSPVEVEWGVGAGTERFYGQVHHTEHTVEDGKQNLYVYCIGASYPMDDEAGAAVTLLTQPRTTGDATAPVYKPGMPLPARQSMLSLITRATTPSYVAGMIAEDQSFDVVREHTPEGGRSWASPGESKWKYLVRLAQEEGFVTYVNKTTLFFYDPVTYLSKRRETFPLVVVNLRRVAKYGPTESFKVLSTENSMPGSDLRVHRVRGIDPRTGATIDKTGEMPTSLGGLQHIPRFSRSHHDDPAHTSGDAQARANAHQREHRWRYRAALTARGQARVHQGTGIVVTGINSEDDGVWFVEGVEHLVYLETNNGNYRYTMNLDLVRDASSRRTGPDTTVGRARRPLLTEDQRRGKRSSEPVFLGGRWRSSFRRETVLQ